ncbi:hypothetical protein D6D24_09918 [Aureobasidium pullulans]|uniref:Uncharacterized protein n=1 Tax=Aureobasidium pullulans TaxID=5580 RepID=A0A4V6T8K6_AURPU|nr:hypothetical protein D6D24_09918 [Aureobasidium pullulans]
MHGAFEIHVFDQRAIDRTLATSPDDAHLKASKYMVSEGFTRHGMFTAIIVCRVLPTPHGNTEHDGVKAFLLQQQRFLEAMIPPHVLTLYLQANEVSAYKDELLTLMRDILVKIPTKAMVLTVSMDRAARSAETNEQFSKINEEAGHMFMSFLWSDVALLPGADALHIPPSSVDFNLIAADDMLEEQRCRSTTIKNLLVVKPVIWIPCSSSINDVIKTTLHAVENYSRSCNKLKKPPDKMLDKAYIEQWNEFLQERISILSEVTRAGKHTCSYVEKGHDSTCVYSCAKCVSYLDCVCATLGTWICLSICTCRCLKCHRKEKAVVDCAAFAKWNDFVTYRRLLERDRRREIFEQNVVNTIGLVKSNKRKFEVIEKDVCLKPSCPNVVHLTRLYSSFCLEVCKKQSAGVATALQTLYFRICARMGCHTRIPRSLNYNKFCSSFCLYDTKKGLQSLPPVLAARHLSSEHNENKVCARSLCNVEGID